MKARSGLGKLVSFAFSRVLLIFILGFAAGMAWQAYGGTARKTIASWSPRLAWMAPPAAPGSASSSSDRLTIDCRSRASPTSVRRVRQRSVFRGRAGTRGLSSGRPKAGPDGFAHPAMFRYDRNPLQLRAKRAHPCAILRRLCLPCFLPGRPHEHRLEQHRRRHRANEGQRHQFAHAGRARVAR